MKGFLDIRNKNFYKAIFLMKIMEYLKVKGKKEEMPIFFPDATKGYVRGVSSDDLINSGIKGVVVNVYHLMHSNLIQKISGNGIHKYMNFNGVVISDSGGFQVMSLIHDNAENGEINDDGAIFKYNKKTVKLTPEKCIQMQFKLGTDIIMCLDDCTYPDMSNEEQEISVERTIKWARRCKQEYLKLTKKLKHDEMPLLFGIIQGGNNLELRKKCADELKKLDFDGYAFGGWPAKNNKFLTEVLKFTCEQMPKEKPKYAMGIGKPENIVECVKMGYNMFDCVIPTREARNNRLYVYKKGLFDLKKLDNKGKFYDYLRVRNKEYCEDKKQISKLCDCYSCKNYSRAQIYGFFKEKNPESIRLATIHNLRFYSMLIERLRK